MKNKLIYSATLLLIVIGCNLRLAFCQATSSDPVSPAPAPNVPFGAGDFLGWAGGVGINLNIRHNNGLNIDFYNGPAAANQKMSMLGANGFFGIGDIVVPATSLPPQWRLDVQDNINIAPLNPPVNNFINAGYRIGGNLALYLPGDPSNWENTFVGRAGNINVNPALAATGQRDTYVGFSAGLRTSGAAQENVFVGVRAGELIRATTGATYIGFEAGRSNSFVNNGGSDFNTFVGYRSGYSDVSSGGNSFFGRESGFNNASLALNNTANYNTFIGSFSGRANVSGFKNTFVGYESGFQNTTAQNTYIGYNAGYSGNGASANDNTFVGYNSGYSSLNSPYNTFVGSEAGYLHNTGEFSTYLGARAGRNNNAGSANTYVGGDAGISDVSGTFNTFIGYLSGVPITATNLINAAAIGYNSRVIASHQMILGGVYNSNTTVNVGIGLSGVNPGPANLLEINATNFTGSAGDIDDQLANGCGGEGLSGLRFRDLTSASDPCPSNGKVLTVDAEGDVILAPSDGGLGFGLCSVGPTVLSDHAGIDLNEFNLQILDPVAFPPATNNNGVLIGTNVCPFAPSGKLTVYSITTTTPSYDWTHANAGVFHQTGDYSAPPASGLDDFIGVLGISDVRDLNPIGVKRTNLGGEFYASQTAENIGARGTAIWASLGRNVGLKGCAATAPVDNFGVWGQVDIVTFPPPMGSNNYAVYGDLFIPPCPLFPCPTSPAAYAGYFNGDVASTTNFFIASDVNLKTNIQDITYPMDIINQLQPKSYEYNQAANPAMTLSADAIHYGLLAQDVYDILPQLTRDCIHPARYDSLGNEIYPSVSYKALNYTEFIPFLIAGMKEQQTQIETLENLVEELSNPLLAPPQGNDDTGNSINNIDITLSSKTIVLNQNDPNPFKEQTTIEYFIPDDAQQVKIIFTDMKGDVLKEVDVHEKGKGLLNVYAADLSSGIYTYTIVANGITVDSKRMVKTK